MNNIEVKMHKTKYASEEHFTIFIDSVPLDHKISELYNEPLLLGLVPSLLDWGMVDCEKEELLKRAKMRAGKIKFPMLLCPDDFDLWCTKVIIEIQYEEDCVLWNCIGIDSTSSDELIKSIENVGSDVEWLKYCPIFKFNRNEYETEFEKFKYIE